MRSALVAVGAAVVAALATAVLLLPNGPAASQVAGSLLLSETFTGATVPDPGFTPLNDACLTGAAGPPPGGAAPIPACPPPLGPEPTPGTTPGYLQLTNSDGYRRGGLLFDQALPANGGLEVTFEQYQYGGSGGDGISFFLVDGAVSLTQAGAEGGGLGYTQRGRDPGVHGGYVGLGLDAYGNYANDSEGKGFRCPADQRSPLGTGYTFGPNAATIRGPGEDITGYCYQTSTVTPPVNPGDPWGSTLPGQLHAGTLGAAKRTVKLSVSPDANPVVRVLIDFGDGNGFQPVLTHTLTTPAPRTYKFGWAGSSGDATDVHLIRNVEVRSLRPLGALNLVKQVDRRNPQPPEYKVGDTVPYEFVVTNTGVGAVSDVAVQDPRVTNALCPRTTLGPAGSATATMTCRGTYVVVAADATAGKAVNTATATGKASDGSGLTTDPSTAEVPVGTTTTTSTTTTSTTTTIPTTTTTSSTTTTTVPTTTTTSSTTSTTRPPTTTTTTTAPPPTTRPWTGPTLPRTGTDFGPPIVLGLGLILSGAYALRLARQRRG